MITNLLKAHFRRFIVELGNSYIKEENNEFLKREKKLTKLHIKEENVVLLFREVFEPLDVRDLNCGTFDIDEAIQNMDFHLLYNKLYDQRRRYSQNRTYENKLFKMFNIVCENVHNEVNMKNIVHAVIFVSNSHKDINISDCHNCLIVVRNVHGKVNIKNCVHSTFIFALNYYASPKITNLSSCRYISIQDRGNKHEIAKIKA